MTDFTEFLTCAKEAADQAVQILKQGLEKERIIRYKGDVDLVTDIDRRSEDKISEIILKRFPDHQILAEEGTEIRGETPYLWVIDPIDGTTNYAHGYPAFCVSIGLCKGDEIIVGLVDAPLFKERWHAVRGQGAWLNGKRIHVSPTKSLSESLLATGFPYDHRTNLDFYLRYFKAFMRQTHGIRRNGSAALDLCNMACGRLDGFWEFKLHAWDITAGILIIEEAGGNVSDFQGNPIDIYTQEVLGSNGLIHEQMLHVMAEVHKDKSF